MLNELQIFGIAQEYFELKKIGDFDNAAAEGFSSVQTNAIQFDKTKERICRLHKIEGMKSCDALDLIIANDRINFIEFKQIGDGNLPDWISDDMELPRKIKDSRDILLTIIRDIRFIHTGKMTKFYQCEKNFIIAFELRVKGVNEIAFHMKWLQIAETIRKVIEKNSIQGEKFNDPAFVHISNFDTEYAKYQS